MLALLIKNDIPDIIEYSTCLADCCSSCNILAQPQHEEDDDEDDGQHWQAILQHEGDHPPWCQPAQH